MKQRPKLIHINGPCGIGKTTIAQKYIDEHPLALSVSSDDIIATLGQWLTHEDEARTLAFELSKSMIDTHLKTGYDVVVPHLLTNLEEVKAFEDIAASRGADFYEFLLVTEKSESVQRMLDRGTWGEPGSPPLTTKDIPIIEKLFDKVQAAAGNRPNTIKIDSIKGDINGTYKQLISSL